MTSKASAAGLNKLGFKLELTCSGESSPISRLCHFTVCESKQAYTGVSGTEDSDTPCRINVDYIKSRLGRQDGGAERSCDCLGRGKGGRNDS